MKRLILLGLLVLSGQVMATKGKCPYTKTFNTEDSEE